MASHRLASLAVEGLIRVLGQRSVIRMSRFALNTARGDVANDPIANGERLILSSVLSSRDRVLALDVGAHVGDWSAMVLELSEGRDAPTVHAFEANPDLAAELSARFSRVDSVSVREIAIGSHDGLATFHVVPGGAGTSSLVKPRGLKATEVTVPATTLDTYARAHAISHIDYIKCDTEGGDLSVARGGGNLFAQGRVGLFQFEYNHRWISARSYLRDAFDLFHGFGYHVGKLTPTGVQIFPEWGPELEQFIEGNYAAIHPDMMIHIPKVPPWNRG